MTHITGMNHKWPGSVKARSNRNYVGLLVCPGAWGLPFSKVGDEMEIGFCILQHTEIETENQVYTGGQSSTDIKNRSKQGESIPNNLEPRNQSEESWSKVSVSFLIYVFSRCCFNKFQHWNYHAYGTCFHSHSTFLIFFYIKKGATDVTIPWLHRKTHLLYDIVWFVHCLIPKQKIGLYLTKM